MALQNAFYIIGIVYMSFMFLVTIAAIVAVFVVKSKIDRIQRKLRRKIRAAHEASANVLTFIRAFKYVVRGDR